MLEWFSSRAIMQTHINSMSNVLIVKPSYFSALIKYYSDMQTNYILIQSLELFLQIFTLIDQILFKIQAKRV